MIRSDLIAKLAELHPQLQAKDAEFAVKVILDALSATLVTRGARRDSRFWQFRAELSSAASRAQSKDRRQGESSRKVCATFQSWKGTQGTGLRTAFLSKSGIQWQQIVGGISQGIAAIFYAIVASVFPQGVP